MVRRYWKIVDLFDQFLYQPRPHFCGKIRPEAFEKLNQIHQLADVAMMTFFRYILTSTLGICFLAFPSLAAEELSILVNHAERPGNSFRIQLYTKASCLQGLANFLQPENIIKSGIAGLEGILKNNTLADPGCLSSILKNWEKTVPVPNLPGSIDPDSDYNFGTFDYDSSEITKLQATLVCFNKYEEFKDYEYDFKNYQANHAKECENKWLTKAQAESLQKKLKEAVRKYDAARSMFLFQRELHSHLATVLRKTVIDEDDYKPLKALRLKSNCYNPYEPNSSDYKYQVADYGKQCKNQWIKKAEFEKIQKQMEAEAKLLKEKNKEPTEYNQLVDVVESEPLFLELADRKQLTKLISIYECYTTYTTEEDIKDFKENNEWLCNGKVTSKEKKEETEKAIRSLFPDLKAAIEKFKAKKAELVAIQQKKFDQANEKKIQNYATRRLIARYSAFLNRGGKAENAEEFCQKFEESDRRDKSYAEQGLKFNYFNSVNTWKVAQEFGLSEAEYSSIKDFTDDFYKIINPAIWNKKLDAKLNAYIDVMNAGMKKMPSYSKTPVVRFATIPKAVLDQHEEGKIVCYDAYTSTSKKQNWKWNGATKFTIFPGTNGRAAFEISTHTSEEEVLFDKDTCFKVLKKEKLGDKDAFTLVEVDKDGMPAGQIPPELLKEKAP